MIALLMAWLIGPLTIDSDPHEWSRLAMRLRGGTCAVRYLPHEVCAEEPDKLHGYQTNRVRVCRDLWGYGTVEITPFYLRGTGRVLWHGNWHS